MIGNDADEHCDGDGMPLLLEGRVPDAESVRPRNPQQTRFRLLAMDESPYARSRASMG